MLPSKSIRSPRRKTAHRVAIFPPLVPLVLLIVACLGCKAPTPDPSQESAIREAVFASQIAYHMRMWQMNVNAQRRRLRPGQKPSVVSARVFYLEVGNWNGGNATGAPVSEAVLKRLESTEYTLHRGTGGYEPGSHLYAGSIRWKSRTVVEVDGGSMGYGGLTALGQGFAYEVTCKNGRWSVTEERITAVT